MDVSNGYMQGSLGPASKPRTQLLVSLPIYTRAGDIERVAHGVYRLVCFPAHRFADLIATALWAGSDSAVSHESALAVYAQAGAMPPVIHVAVPRTFSGERSGVVSVQRLLVSPKSRSGRTSP